MVFVDFIESAMLKMILMNQYNSINFLIDPFIVVVTEVDSVKQESSQPGEQAVEKCKVFVSNLRYETKESDLTPLFIQYGELKDIRLVKQAGGKTRGFGYVEYKDEVRLMSWVMWTIENV